MASRTPPAPHAPGTPAAPRRARTRATPRRWPRCRRAAPAPAGHATPPVPARRSGLTDHATPPLSRCFPPIEIQQMFVSLHVDHHGQPRFDWLIQPDVARTPQPPSVASLPRHTPLVLHACLRSGNTGTACGVTAFLTEARALLPPG